MEFLSPCFLTIALVVGLLPAPTQLLHSPLTVLTWVWPIVGAEILLPFAPPVNQWSAGHRGIDIAANEGQQIRAIASGRVLFTGSIAGRGVISIVHPASLHELRSTYEPVSANVKTGDLVEAGQIIGTVSIGGHCSHRCLHLGLKTMKSSGPQYLDPLSVLQPFTAILKPTSLPVTSDALAGKPFAAALPRHGYSAESSTGLHDRVAPELSASRRPLPAHGLPPCAANHGGRSWAHLPDCSI